MGSLVRDFKRQASFFLREKIKTARLVLTDVTPAQLLTEEITSGDSIATNGQAMRLISRAAFDVDDYERTVHILHHRLCKFDTWNWRASYNALVLLEHLLTHGPLRIADEFECDRDTIRDMATFHYVDDKGFNWGMSVKKKSERVMNLLEDRSYLKEERARARKLTVGIKGFGSFSQSPIARSSKDFVSDSNLRSNSLQFGTHRHAAVDSNLLASEEYSKLLANNKIAEQDEFLTDWSQTYGSDREYVRHEEDHPFWDKEHRSTRVSLLSSV
ncbi:enth domain-containing protein c794.11c [Phtheirospermum japonicum]|uniref:Enth domain-containing protein c794.11c n=1 Tax=Phtheirospermum japonicum TaxID=374723 RepID=A0A830CQW1_9LAMI|nr:enth domain-containing protein c794.11c [Phtheirospermum japonicum]